MPCGFDCSYAEVYNYQVNSADGTSRSSSMQHSSLDGPSLKKTKDDILRTMSSISKAGGNVEEQIEMLLSLPYELDICDYTKAIQSCNSVDLLSLLMHELHRRGLVPDLLLFNVYLKKCEDLHEKEEAFRTYGILLSDGVVPDKHTMILLIRCCLQSNSPQEAEGVIADAFNRHVEVNSYMYNLLIDYYARRNQPSNAFYLRIQMANHGIAPDEYTISSLMASCCPQLPSRSQLQVLLKDVKTSPLPARSVCASALFSGIAKAPNIENHQKLKMVVSFFNALRSRGYVLGQHAYTSLMACCAKLGDVAQAKEFIRDMQASGVEPNQYTLTAFISACSKAKDYASALAAFNFMRGSRDAGNRTRPNKYTYEAMLVAAGNAGRFEDAMAIYSDMRGEGIQADSSTYARLIIVCGLCQQLQQGLRFVEEFNYHRLPRTSFFYHALIDLYSRCHQFDLAYEVLDEVRRSPSIEASHHHYEPIIRVLVETRRWEEVDALLDTWEAISYTTLQFLILNSHKQQEWRRVVHYAEVMHQNGQKPYSALVSIIEHAQQQLKSQESQALSQSSQLPPPQQSTPLQSMQLQSMQLQSTQQSTQPTLLQSPQSPQSPLPLSALSPNPSLSLNLPKESSNTMQFLEGKVNSIPEFIPMHLRKTQAPASFTSSLLGSQASYSRLVGSRNASLSPLEQSVFDDGGFGESTITLEDLDYDLSTDFGLFNDFDFM